MKKLCILGASLLALGVFNSANAQVRFGLIGGANLNQQIDHYQGETLANQAKTGFHLGGLADICLANNLTLQPGLMYIMKGGLQQRSSEVVTPDGLMETKIKDKLTLHYIEMPLQLTYRIGVGSGNVVLGAGGYGAVLADAGVEAKRKVTLNDNDDPNLSFENDRDLSIGDDPDDDIKRTDFGLVGSLGYEFASGLFLRAGVDAGLSNIITTNSFLNTQPATVANDPTSRNVSYLFSLGYWFGRNSDNKTDNDL